MEVKFHTNVFQGSSSEWLFSAEARFPVIAIFTVSVICRSTGMTWRRPPTIMLTRRLPISCPSVDSLSTGRKQRIVGQLRKKVTRVVILGASCHLCWTVILIVEPICTFCSLSLSFPLSLSLCLSLHTTCLFCANQQETEIHFVFQCPVYNQLRSKYLPDIINVCDPRKHLISLMNSSSQERILNVAKVLACALNLRSSKLDANTWVSPYVDVHRAALQTCVLMCPL